MKGIPVEATFVSLAQYSTVKSPSKLSGGELRGLEEPDKSMLPQLWPPATDEVDEAAPEEVLVAVDEEEPVTDSVLDEVRVAVDEEEPVADRVLDEVDEVVAVLVTVVVLVEVVVAEAEDDAAVQTGASKETHKR